MQQLAKFAPNCSFYFTEQSDVIYIYTGNNNNNSDNNDDNNNNNNNNNNGFVTKSLKSNLQIIHFKNGIETLLKHACWEQQEY